MCLLLGHLLPSPGLASLTSSPNTGEVATRWTGLLGTGAHLLVSAWHGLGLAPLPHHPFRGPGQHEPQSLRVCASTHDRVSGAGSTALLLVLDKLIVLPTRRARLGVVSVAAPPTPPPSAFLPR